MSELPPEKGLQRGLNSLQVQLISLGGIIGSCYFLGIGDSLYNLGIATIYSFALGGLIVWLVANAMGELCVGMPRPGSFISHAKELIGRPWAAGVGWSYWVNWCSYAPSEMIAGGLIMHQFMPTIPVSVWAICFGIIISFINLSSVKNFGKIESVLALIKICAILFFCVMALLIWSGIIGSQGFLGTKVLMPTQNLSVFFPVGLLVIFQRMVMILVNYQGTEIVALSAAETQNPESTIPLAIRYVSIRIIAAFIVPVFLLMTILPSKEATLTQSVFVTALERYHFPWAGSLFAFVILTAAISCANSGLYAAIRALYSLATEKLAPSLFARVNKNQVPSWATYTTVLVCWAFIPLFLFYEGTALYKLLLAVSGFTGAICWISISWSQLRFRKKVNCGDIVTGNFSFKAPGFPYLSYLGIWIQVFSLVFVIFDPSLNSCLYLGVPILVIPMLVIYFQDKSKAKKMDSGTKKVAILNEGG